MSQLAASSDDHCADLDLVKHLATYLPLDVLPLLLGELLVILIHPRLAVSADE